MRVDADTFGGTMIDRDEHCSLTFACNRRYQVGTPLSANAHPAVRKAQKAEIVFDMAPARP